LNGHARTLSRSDGYGVKPYHRYTVITLFHRKGEVIYSKKWVARLSGKQEGGH